MKKRLFFVLLFCAFFLCLIYTQCFAVSSWEVGKGKTVNNVIYYLKADGNVYVGGLAKSFKPGTNVTIESRVYEHKVTSIQALAFAYFGSENSRINTLTIPEGVMDIGDCALECEIKTLVIPASLTNIKTSTFGSHSYVSQIKVSSKNERLAFKNDCLYDKQTGIAICYCNGSGKDTWIIPDEVKSVSEEAFHSSNNSKLKKLRLSSNLKILNANISLLGNLKTIVIPKDMDTLPMGFSQQLSINLTHGNNWPDIFPSLMSFEVEKGNPTYSSENGVLVDNESGTILKCPPKSKLKEYTIGKNIVAIGDAAFWNCDNLQSITIPSSVKSIGAGAFESCDNLLSIVVPSSVEKIGDKAFAANKDIIVTVYENSYAADYFKNDKSVDVIVIPEGEQAEEKKDIIKIIIPDDDYIVGVNKKINIQAKVVDGNGADIKNVSLVWKSLDEEVATISLQGVLTGKKPGQVSIECSVKDDPDNKAVIQVNVNKLVEKLVSDVKKIVIFEGTTENWIVKAYPDDSTNKQIKYSQVEDNASAFIYEDGMILGNLPGKSKVCAEATDGSGKRITCEVIVEPKNPVAILGSWYNDLDPSYFAFEIQNQCKAKTVVNIEFDIVFQTFEGAKINEGSHILAKRISVKPGSKKKLEMSIFGANSAYKKTVRITKVYFSDDSEYSIPKSSIKDWTVTRK